MHADIERTLAGDLNLPQGLVAAVGEGEPVVHAASTSKSIVKLSGRSVVWWFPLGTPILLTLAKPLKNLPTAASPWKW